MERLNEENYYHYSHTLLPEARISNGVLDGTRDFESSLEELGVEERTESKTKMRLERIEKEECAICL